MADFNLLSERIKYLKNTKQISSAKIAELAGVKQSSVFNWEHDVTKTIKSSVATKLGKALNVNPMWLATGVDSPVKTEFVSVRNEDSKTDDHCYLIKQSDVVFACGNGRLPYFEEMEDGTTATYKASWFQHRQINPEHCVRYRVYGDSMSPFIMDGDFVLVDTNDTKPITGKVYALVLNDELKVKRLITKANGGLIIRSDNKNYPDDEVNPTDVGTYLKILGRVRDRSGDNGL